MDSPFFESLQGKRREIYTRVAHMPFAEQVHRPRLDGWSPLEVLEHLNIHDHWVFGNPSVRKGFSTGSRILHLAKRLRVGRLTIPTAPFLVPKGGLTVPELAATSDAQHSLLADLVANANQGETVTHVFPFGSFTVDGACELLDAHYDYHLRRL